MSIFAIRVLILVNLVSSLLFVSKDYCLFANPVTVCIKRQSLHTNIVT